MTRTSLASDTGLSPATVSRVVGGLRREGWIAEGSTAASGRIGRAAVSLHLEAHRGVVVGVDLGGSNCRAVVADLLGTPLHRTTVPTPGDLDAVDLANWVAHLVGRLRRRGGGAPLHAVSVGLPGVVTPDGTLIAGAPNLRQIEGVAFADRLRKRLAVPLDLDNDSNLALLGEMTFGAAHGMQAVVMITVGTGVGAGIAVDGRLLRGRTGLVGEFGFVPVGPQGLSLEHLLGGAGLLRQAAAGGLQLDSATQLFAREAPAAARPIRKRFRHALLLILTTLTTAYEPEAIIVGGGLVPAIEAELSRTRAAMAELLPAAPRIAVSTLGDLAGALGAVVAACRHAYLHLGVEDSQLAGLPVTPAIDGFLSPSATAALLEENGVPVATA